MTWCTIYHFFFSSRRRHTRSLRDWSSDVCSSDLILRVRRGTRVGHRSCRSRPLAAQPFPARHTGDMDKGYSLVTGANRGLGLEFARQLLARGRSEEHTSELQSRRDIVCRLLLEKKKHSYNQTIKNRDSLIDAV